MSHLDEAFKVLQGASDAQLKKLYLKQPAQQEAQPESTPSEEDLALLEQSLMPKG